MSQPSSPVFTGKWRLSESDNFDLFLQDINVGFLKRQAVKIVNSEHHIEQDGDQMKVDVLVTGKKGKHQVYAIGESFKLQLINVVVFLSIRYFGCLW